MTNNSEMTAIEITGFGGPDVLTPVRRDIPQPEANDVLIEIAAAGVNRPDCLQRAGGYPPPPGVTDIPGLEVAGTVVQAGSDVSESVVGQQVMALVPGGGYATHVCADVSNTLPIPSCLSLKEAAAVPETFFTVWHNVFERGRLEAGETFLVHGGSSGIGTTAIQLAKALGSKVITTAGSDEKCDYCLSLGADLAINYREKSFEEEVLEFTSGNGVDVILDMVGGDYVTKNYKAAAMDGRIVQIAFLRGPKADVNFLPVMLKRLTHTGSTLRARSIEFKAGIASQLQEHVWPLIEAGKVKLVMDSEYDLVDASKAHLRMESSEHMGKIVLIP